MLTFQVTLCVLCVHKLAMDLTVNESKICEERYHVLLHFEVIIEIKQLSGFGKVYHHYHT